MSKYTCYFNKNLVKEAAFKISSIAAASFFEIAAI